MTKIKVNHIFSEINDSLETVINFVKENYFSKHNKPDEYVTFTAQIEDTTIFIFKGSHQEAVLLNDFLKVIRKNKEI